ncbi:BCD family MFS transporter [Phaeobacter sp.]|uniref:BCD family MFS transporter n=1 Tax=Phaeobacter sp. TaxID=1902409 RepID=UPI0025E57F2E|nr:BCD family MFS transporter [Phaeobacter sp.]
MLGWVSIFRLGLVQMALGAIVVLMTSTLNRVMVVELALPAVLPGFLVALHYAIQITRPNWGFRSDTGGSRSRWILGGMAVLALGAVMAALAILLVPIGMIWVLLLSILAYGLIGIGVGASGTSLLALLATATEPRRRAAAATMTWLMMILGIAGTAIATGALLDPYSPQRLIAVVALVAVLGTAVTALALWRVEQQLTEPAPTTANHTQSFLEGLQEIWQEPKARQFTIFVFLSMTAYFMQELILEPYAGLVFGYSLGQSTQLSGAQNGGVFLGMLTVGVLCTGFRMGELRSWVVAGCGGSALVLVVIAAFGQIRGADLLAPVIALGFFNGMFAVAAIGSMMQLAGNGREKREGTRMGLWGAAQAIAAGFGGLVGAALVDLARSPLGDAEAFGAVFLFEAALFLAAMWMAVGTLSLQTKTTQLADIPGE